MSSSAVNTRFLSLISEDNFIQRMLCHMVNHKIQDFQDPLTSTLVLMATSPLQMVLCEAGLLPFKTTLLPVLPYSILTMQEIEHIRQILVETCDKQLHETVESSGQYTLTVTSPPQMANAKCSAGSIIICRRSLLHAFVAVMMMLPANKDETQLLVNKTLCNIVLQRFMASVSTPSEIVSSVTSVLAAYKTPSLKEEEKDDEEDPARKKRPRRSDSF